MSNEPLCLENQVCFSLYSAANAMVRAYRPVLDALDLTYPQYLAMLVLWQHKGISVKTLGERLHLDSGTLTPLLKRLESKGLLLRGRSEQDERVRVLTLTDAGQALQARAADVPEQMLCRSAMPRAELQQLKSLCDTLWQQLER
ncbi:MarR family winged helix-turn-helix transcriptional regulator [Shewanella chilikensis]|jgi:DNA-binding MarR family transcriptional regulator|uniref:MarR family winged helix-turn-helix transcriptional regulator n=1 Tax=Shewanella chilikensis TaxID=558541 RepID=UPI001CD1B6C1|nr:MarR family transcriptional regulator [Shewanella chilikensis]MCA0948989.1 MarR family transcriptional regulator [Shewanella chilikensis]